MTENEWKYGQGLGQTTGATISVVAPPQTGPSRELTLKERVLETQERVAVLERQNLELQQELERLARLLVEQIGLVF